MPPSPGPQPEPFHTSKAPHTSPSAAPPHVPPLPAIPDGRCLQDLYRFNQTRVDWGEPPCTLRSLIARAASQHPTRPALLTGSETLSHAGLEDAIRHWVQALRLRGVREGHRVAVLSDKSFELVVALLALDELGATSIPASARTPGERLRALFEETKPDYTLASQVFTHRPEGLEPGCVVWTEEVAAQTVGDYVALPTPGGPDRLTTIMFTSGTTGRPKAVGITQASLYNFVRGFALQLGLGPHDLVTSLAEVTFDPFIAEVYAPLSVGGASLLIDSATARAGYLLKTLLESTRPTLVSATPASYWMLLAAGWQGWRPLRLVCGGEAMTPKLAQALLERADAVFNVYGPTESTVLCATWKVTPPANEIPLGRPMPNCRLYVLRANLTPAAVGELGEICIGGVGVTPGYLNDSVRSAAHFVQDPYTMVPGGRLYRTGDRGWYGEDGVLWFGGRDDRQVKVRGHRVELVHLERVLEDFPGVRRACVEFNPDEDEAPVCYLLVEEKNSIQLPRLRAHCSQWFPPEVLAGEVVCLTEFPTNLHGKIDRKALTAKASSPGASAPPPKASASPPQALEERKAGLSKTPLQELVSASWKAVLGLESLGIDDDFAHLGGTSLQAVRLLTHLSTSLGVELPYPALNRARTVRAMAQVLEGCRPPEKN